MTSVSSPNKWWAYTGTAPQEIVGAVQGVEWWTAPVEQNDRDEVGFAGIPEPLRSAPPSLVVTDVDSTLINEEVIDELATMAGHREKVAEITERAMRGELDFETSLRERVGFLRGLPVEALDEVARALTLTPGTASLIRWVHSVGAKFGIVSGGFTQVIGPIAEDLGIDHVCAIDLEVKHGALTGKTSSPIVDADSKVRALKRWAGNKLATSVAVGDGANDIPMLQAAGVGIAFCAKPAVRDATRNFLNIRRLDAVAGLLGHSPA